MSVAIVTGSSGLIGSEAARFFHAKGMSVVGIDNDMRGVFFGAGASVKANAESLVKTLKEFRHSPVDIRDRAEIFKIFSHYGSEIKAVVHAAAQPSHHWAAGDPEADFSINATATLILLEAARKFAPDSVFLFTSTNKVYGDRPNQLPLDELETRWEISSSHPYFPRGIDESMPIDSCLHSLYGVSKLSADLMVQEYGRYFKMKTGVFRGGCLTGPSHAGVEEHGFLSYLVKCAASGTPYKIYGYKGKQVRDNIHSRDFVEALWYFFEEPKFGAVYNLGGSRELSCSVIEAIALAEKTVDRPMNFSLVEKERPGDPIWWITDNRSFQTDYPNWRLKYDLVSIVKEIADSMRDRIRFKDESFSHNTR